ncbi:MAG: hypothetical protein AAGD11_05360 [Planctomycetota bacterium]
MNDQLLLGQNSMLVGAEVWSATEQDAWSMDSSLGRLDSTSYFGDQPPAFEPRLHFLESQPEILSVPIFKKSVLSSVLLLQFARRPEAVGTAEIWSRDARDELALEAGYYSELDRFQAITRFVSFPRGAGLPGLSWEERDVKIIAGLGSSPDFMRAAGAREVGLDVGLAIPILPAGQELQAVLLLLSSSAASLGQAFGVWRVTNGSSWACDERVFTQHCDRDLAGKLINDASPDLVAMVVATGAPVVTELGSPDSLDLEGQGQESISWAIAIPIWRNKTLQSVATIYG